MKVKLKHFGRMCRCTKCGYPIYVTYDSVNPPVHPEDQQVLRYFDEDDVPLEWQRGDVITEVYEVRERIGSGGMGIVYRVFHRGWTETIAVKTPKPVKKPSRKWMEYFERECEMWMDLPPHPNMVECYYFRRLGGTPRVFIEYIDGNDLQYMLATKRLYKGERHDALKRMIDIAIQMAWGLQHAHEHGVVHRDVKPSNVLIAKDYQAKVTDFGLARVFESQSGSGSDSSTKSVGGTPVFRSPEHVPGKEPTHRSDIWSWAVSVLEMFAGEVYWQDGRDAPEALSSLLEHGSRFDTIPKLPGIWVALLEQCFQLDQADRPADMGEVVGVLKDLYKTATGSPYPRDTPQSGGETPNVLNNRAVSLLDVGKAQQSEVLWRRVIKKNPEHLPAMYNTRLYLWRTGRLTDAEVLQMLLNRADENPQEWRSTYLAARVLIEGGDCARAIELLEPLFEDRSEERDVAFALAMAQNKVSHDKRLVWDFPTGSPMCTAVCLSSDGWRGGTGGVDGRIRLWDVSLGKGALDIQAHEGRVFCMAFSQDERFFVSGGADSLVRIWDTSTGNSLHSLSGHQDVVRALALSTDGALALSAGRDGALRLWDTESGECIRAIDAHESSISSVSMSGDGTFALTGSRDRTLKYWDLQTGYCIRTLTGNAKPVAAVYMSSDRRRAYSASGKKVKIWDLETGEILESFLAHEKNVQSISVNEDGGYALSATLHGTMKVWDIKTRQCLRSLRGYAPATLSQDGRYAICGSPTGEFQIWSLYCGETPFQAPYLIARDKTD